MAKTIRKIRKPKFEIRNKLKKLTEKPIMIVERYPFRSFLVVLAVLFVLIALGNILRAPKAEVAVKTETPKNVELFHIGTAPKINVQGQVDRSDVVQIIAQVPGVVQTVYVTEGQEVSRGTWLVGLSTNYQGGNISSLQRQLAEKQYQNVVDTYDMQKDLIKKSRDLANKVDDNNEQLRSIQSAAANDNANLITLDGEIINGFDANIAYLESTNVGGSNDALILQAKQYKAQVLAGLNQLNSAQRSISYQSDGNKIPAELGHAQKDITLKQLEIQEKALDLSREASRLQLAIAQANEALMYPATPLGGIVERINVHVGQLVSPGMVIATVRGLKDPTQIIAFVPENIARKVSKTEQSVIIVGDKTLKLIPSYISQVATSGSLFSVLYQIPDDAGVTLANNSYITVQIPVGYPDSGAVIPFVPLDSVYQTQSNAYVFIVRQGKAVGVNVTLGTVYGRFVEVQKGLQNGDTVILDRSVIAGDSVTSK